MLTLPLAALRGRGRIFHTAVNRIMAQPVSLAYGIWAIGSAASPERANLSFSRIGTVKWRLNSA